MARDSDSHGTGRVRVRRVAILSVMLLLGLAAGGAAVHPATRAGFETLPVALEGLPNALEEVRVVAVKELWGWVDHQRGSTGFRLAAAPNPMHPPILLVPGWSDRATELEEFRLRLVEAGWSADRILPLGFRDPVGSNLEHAVEVATAVERLRMETGSDRVDIVAFSMGGLAVRHFLLFGGGSRSARKVAFLGTPHRGTVVAVFAWGAGGREMIPGSPFLERLNADRPLEGVEIMSFHTPLDTRVVPNTSALLPGVANVEICCPGHSGMLRDGPTFALVADFLLREGDPGTAEGAPDQSGVPVPSSGPFQGAGEAPRTALDPMGHRR